MSEIRGSSPGERAWRFYLEDMIEFAAYALGYTAGMGQVDFERNRMVFDATVRNIELIGEATRHTSEDMQKTAPHIPWRQIIVTPLIANLHSLKQAIEAGLA